MCSVDVFHVQFGIAFTAATADHRILPPQGPASVLLVVLLNVDSRCWASAESCPLKAHRQDSS